MEGDERSAVKRSKGKSTTWQPNLLPGTSIGSIVAVETGGLGWVQTAGNADAAASVVGRTAADLISKLV